MRIPAQRLFTVGTNGRRGRASGAIFDKRAILNDIQMQSIKKSRIM